MEAAAELSGGGDDRYWCRIEIPRSGKQFNYDLNTLYLNQNSKKSYNLRIKQVIVHPGDTSIIKTSHQNANFLLSKSDGNCAYIWNVDKHKYVPQNKENSHADIPDLTYLGLLGCRRVRS